MNAAQLLGPDGPFAKADPDFRPREAQQTLTLAIEHCLAERGELIAEAGTGTGKTFAYLVPALKSGLKVIVSTGTKALQDQLYHRDLPRVRKLLGLRDAKLALLKGRSNYLCLHRLERTVKDGELATRQLVGQLNKVRKWAPRALSGDRSELSTLPEDAPIWPHVTSTTENCLGSECPFWEDCYVVKARRRAQSADLVVVNHHLLFSDMAVRREGFGEVLPGAQAYILDEAHQIAESATSFFSTSLSLRQLLELSRDTLAESSQASGALSAVREPCATLEKAAKDFRLVIGAYVAKAPLAPVLGEAAASEAFEALAQALEGLSGVLAAQAERSEGLTSCTTRATELATRLALMRTLPSENDEQIRWYELFTSGFTLNCTPLDIANPLSAFRQQTGAAWIYTSATLSVGEDFRHFQNETGSLEAKTLKLQSPFDYQRQALLYLPRMTLDPNAMGYTEAVLEAAVPVLKASGGRAFLLFTSHRALRAAAEWLPGQLEFPLFVQGTAPRNQLLKEFQESGNGLLLGAASFWEGVDVPGEALSVVIIDKLPFGQIGDPVLEAKLEAIRSRGGNPFADYQLPSAVLALKQGVGRLIRKVEDRGVLMLCDPRLLSKSYGRTFLQSLPDMRRTRELSEVEGFFAPAAISQTPT